MRYIRQFWVFARRLLFCKKTLTPDGGQEKYGIELPPTFKLQSATADKFVSCTHLLLLLPSPLRLSNDDDGRGIGHTSLQKRLQICQLYFVKSAVPKRLARWMLMKMLYSCIAEVAIGILGKAGEKSSNKLVR